MGPTKRIILVLSSLLSLPNNTHLLPRAPDPNSIQSILQTMMNNASSFTALLELPPTQVVQLLHDVVLDSHSPQCHTPTLAPPLDCPVEIEAPKPVVKRKKIKDEDAEGEVVRVGGSRGKKRKEESQSELPYVYVRARRGQATDSHSLAERARREKINARMKLLQEMVPGCSKISGIALVLDEIINHVQALQRQVEFLSMQLAAVNPRIEFNLDRFLDEENAFVDGRYLSMHPAYEWSDPQGNGLCEFRRSFVQKWQHDAHQQPLWLKEESHLESATIPETTHLMNDSPETECMLLRQLKVEQT